MTNRLSMTMTIRLKVWQCKLWFWVWMRRRTKKETKTRSSWLNCALRDDEVLYWVSIGHYEAVAVGNLWYWVSRGHLCLYVLNKVVIWSGVTTPHRFTDRLWKIVLLSSWEVRVEASKHKKEHKKYKTKRKCLPPRKRMWTRYNWVLDKEKNILEI